jgi:sugar phosphate isomerase/epimerase
MQLGIFSKIMTRPTLEESLDAVRQADLDAVQFNFETAGYGHMPTALADGTCSRIRTALETRQLKLAALSGTFNIIHPNIKQRQDGMKRLAILAATAKELDTQLITFCTGTCNPDSLWQPHPDNGTSKTWRCMLTSMQEAVTIAQQHGVILVFEPEVNNIVDSAQKARRLLDEIRSEHLQVVIDGANLFHAGQLPRMREILDEAFQLLGDSIRLAHAKDLERDGDAGDLAAGQGVLDFEYYLHLLHEIGFDGSIILHSLDETQVAASVEHIRCRWPS